VSRSLRFNSHAPVVKESVGVGEGRDKAPFRRAFRECQSDHPISQSCRWRATRCYYPRLIGSRAAAVSFSTWPRVRWSRISARQRSRTIDMTTEILGAKYDSPIVIAPTSSNRAFHPDGEVAVARAARTGNHLQMLSTVATTSIEDAIAARGAPVWFQLYPTRKWEVAEALVRRAGASRIPSDCRYSSLRR
jgi:hypothetical protein